MGSSADPGRKDFLETSKLGEEKSRLPEKPRLHHNRVPRLKERLRIASNMGLIVGQCVLLFSSRDAGLAIIICSSLLSVPFFIKSKMWDVICLIAFMQVINVVGLFVK